MQGTSQLIVDGILWRQVLPQRGILAGVATNATELHSLLLDEVNPHRNNHKIARLNIFADDMTIYAMLPCRRAAAKCALAASEDISHMLHNDIDLTIAPRKGAAISNDKAFARTVRLSPGRLGGKPSTSIRALGNDCGAANANSSTCTRNQQVKNFGTSSKTSLVFQLVCCWGGRSFRLRHHAECPV